MGNKATSKCALALALMLALASCGTGRRALGGGDVTGGEETGAAAGQTDIEFLRKVHDNEVYAGAISAKLKFTISAGARDLSVAGSLKMKRDEVIRIQLTPLGIMEAGRIEFTKDHVLIMDRLDKEYIKVGYDKVDFLERNGLDFYALQALFWNCLFIPGTQRVTESSLGCFGVDRSATGTAITMEHGDISYRWTADGASGLITAVDMRYGTGDGANVNCTYGDFQELGSRMFPTTISLTMGSGLVKGAPAITLDLGLKNMDTSDDWETFTGITGKFKEVTIQDVMNRLLGM